MAISIRNQHKLEYLAFHLSSILALTDNRQHLKDEFAWLKILNKTELKELKSSLYNAISEAIKTNDWTNVSETIESWIETAEIIADKKLTQKIKKSTEEYRQGKFTRWEDVQKELKHL